MMRKVVCIITTSAIMTRKQADISPLIRLGLLERLILNLYANANPLRYIDSSGLATIEIPIPEAPAWVPEWVKAAGARAVGVIGAIFLFRGDTPMDDPERLECEEECNKAYDRDAA